MLLEINRSWAIAERLAYLHPMDRRLLILWLTIFLDLLGFTLFIPVEPHVDHSPKITSRVVQVARVVP
jgi:hypothetical protein